jgi:hypothetical protein
MGCLYKEVTMSEQVKLTDDDGKTYTLKQLADPAEFFAPTSCLRWIVRTVEMCDGPGNDLNLRTLQQAWQGDRGTIRWEDVDEVYDD